jgi:hypothetical protein
VTQPRRPDEIALYARLRADGRCPGPNAVYEAFDALSIPEKRGFYLLDKWDAKGWWEYGVSLRCGWFTENAPEALIP